MAKLGFERREGFGEKKARGIGRFGRDLEEEGVSGCFVEGKGGRR
jgi:hypothetical protein